MSFKENCQTNRNLYPITRGWKPHRTMSSIGFNKPPKLRCASSITFFLIVFGLIQVPGASGALNDFKFYWNVPTFMCHKYGMFFEDVPSFGIQQNKKDQFRDDRMAIIYDPGFFPALLKDENGRTVRRNGGVPQEGNLTHHLEMFTRDVDEQIEDVDFSGVAVIDFESWRPVFRQNWASLAPYRDLSQEIERTKHPFWNKKRVLNEAVKRFEKSARLFMEDTLRLARNLRPKASWGYYAYPYCFNSTPNAPTARCDPNVYEENNRLSWMFNLQHVILPSVYLGTSLSKKDKTGLITGRVNEAIRISKRSSQSAKKPVLAYFWYKYQDDREKFLTREDVYEGFKTIKDLGGDGIILWGSSKDLNSKLKCQAMKDYLTETLGPMARKFKVASFPQNVRNFDVKITYDESFATFAPASSTNESDFNQGITGEKNFATSSPASSTTTSDFDEEITDEKSSATSSPASSTSMSDFDEEITDKKSFATSSPASSTSTSDFDKELIRLFFN